MRKNFNLFPLLFVLWMTPTYAAPITGTIQIKRGSIAAIGTLLQGQPYYATDTNALWIGTATGNRLIYNGTVGAQGVAGSNGWSPVFSVVTDGARNVLQVTDWAGGSGAKPATGSYLGASGFTSVLASAVNIRGAAGATGSVGLTGSQGNPGSNGAAATISIGTVTAGAAGTTPTVTNTGTSNAAVLAFSLPVPATPTNGTNGTNGAAGTVAVGTVTTLAAGSAATVTNTGTTSAASLNFGIPAGSAGAVGATGLTGAAGPSGVVAATLPITYAAQTVGINPATTTTAGSLSAADKVKLDGFIYRTSNAAIPAILSAASTTVTVTWTSPFADTNYRVMALPIGSSIVAVDNAVSKTTTGVTFNVKNIGLTNLLVSTATLDVIAIHD